MTLENAKKWYKAFMEQGRIKEAEDIAKKRPQVKEEEPTPEPKPKKTTSKKDELEA